MLDVNKLAKGDRIVVKEDEERKFLVTDVTNLPKWLYVRQVYEDGSQDMFQSAWYVDKLDVDKMEFRNGWMYN